MSETLLPQPQLKPTGITAEQDEAYTLNQYGFNSSRS
jgi:hypothetical protein